jgi:hypothetical protein
VRGSLRASWCSAIEFVAWRHPSRSLAMVTTSERASVVRSSFLRSCFRRHIGKSSEHKGYEWRAW